MARRVPVEEPYPEPGSSYDYADAFRAVGDPGGRSAEQVARTTFDELPAALRAFLRIAHGRVLGFRLGPPSSPGHVGGWAIVVSEPDVVVLRTTSSSMTGHLVARRTADGVRLTTFLRWERRRVAAAVWAIVGPAHRAIAPPLLDRGVRG